MSKIITYSFSILLFLSLNTANVSAQFCSGKKTLTAISGTISDGSGPNDYQALANCEWLIQPAGASSVTLFFTEFDTEGCCDFLEVYDGTSSSDPLIGSFSGNKIPPQITSSGGSIYVLFHSDPTTQKSGWTALYSSCVPSVSPIISNVGPTSFCKGDSVSLVSSKGSSYIWSNGATSRIIKVKTTGTYSVFVTDSNACSAATTPVNVNSISLSVSITNVGSLSICKGDSAKLIGTATTGSIYQWLLNNNNISAATNSSYYADSTGIYSLKVFNGPCTLTSNIITLQVKVSPAVPKITASGPLKFCAGGSVVLTSSTASNYTWSTAATTKTITVTSSGSYTVQTSNGTCSSTSTPVQVTNSGPSFNASASPASICSGGKSNLSVTANPSTNLTYSWAPSAGLSNPNISNPVASVTSNTTYQLTVTDTISGCSGTSLLVVSVFTPQAASVSPSGTINSCQGSPVTLTASAGGTYLWSNGATTQTLIVNTSNTYSVVITYPGGCKSTSNSVLVNINPTPSVSITNTGSTNLCQGDSIELIATAPAGSAYQWSSYGSPIPGATASTYWVSTSGNYYVNVTSNNCSAISNSIYVSLSSSSGYITPYGNTTFCSGDSVQLYFSGYGQTYQWLFNGNPITGANSYIYYASDSGSFSIKILDYNGCNYLAAPITINVLNQQGTPVISPSGPTSFCNGQSVTLSSSTAGSYLWSNGATSKIITVIKSGSYTVITGNPGSTCTAKSLPITITNSTPVAIATTSNDTICTGGTVNLDVDIGSSMIESFDPINTSNWSIINLGTVGNNACGTVSGNALYFDGNGTRSAETIDLNISGGGQISFDLVIGNGSYPCEMADYGEDIFLEFSTDAGSTWSNINTYLTGGTYSNFTLVTENIPTAAQTQSTRFRWSQTLNSGSGFDNWAIDNVTINGVTSAANYVYSWSPSTGLDNSNIKSPIATVNSSTLYTVTVTDKTNYSCSGTSSVYVYAQNPGADIYIGGPTSFCIGGYVLLTASPGTSYLWSNGSTNQSVTITQAGSYTVAVVNPYGCTGTYTSAPVVITTSNTPFAVITANGPTAFCQGGSVVLSANGGSSFQWSNGATTQSIIVNQAGTYTVKINDAGGCYGSASSAPISISALPIPNIPVITQNGNMMISSAPAGNQWYYNYQLINGATNASYLATQNGLYSVLFTDVNGCSSMSGPYTMVTGINENSSLENSFNAYPNPFSGETNISYTLQFKTHVQLEIYNLLGAKITTLRDGIQIPGEYNLILKDIPAGAYMLILKTSENNYVRKILSMQ